MLCHQQLRRCLHKPHARPHFIVFLRAWLRILFQLAGQRLQQLPTDQGIVFLPELFRQFPDAGIVGFLAVVVSRIIVSL